MDQLLQDQFGDASWSRWRTVLRATFAETMSKADLEVFEELTGRTSAPTEPARELWAICGRRAGKSMVAALIAVFCSTCREYQFAHGERGTFMLVAADRRQARVMHRYITGLLNSHPVLESLIVSQTKTAIELNNGIDIEIMTASYRTIRGYTCIGAVLDELAFWPTDDAAEPDREIIAALRPAMATTPEAVLVCVSSPYARRGELWRAHRAHYGQDDDDILVVQGTTQQLNPTISEAVIARAYQDDPINARAEYGAEFRSDAEGFVTSEAIQGCVVPDRLELRPIKGERYVAFIDFAGGSGADSATLAIAHEEKRNDQRVLILDAIREVKPPFSPEQACDGFANLMSHYRCASATADRYAGQFPVERMRQYGITMQPSKMTKSDIYKEMLPLLNSGEVELLDVPRLHQQLGSLERRVARGGRDSIDHAPNAHDDLANAAAGAVTSLVTGLKPMRVVQAHWG